MSEKNVPINAERRLLDYSRAAAYLGISLRRMKDIGGPQGEILRIELGSRVLFDKEDLDRFIDKLKRAS